MTVNERIKHLRKDVLRLNQRCFAHDLGMAQTGVSSMEQDGATITDRVIKSICLSYGVNEEWLRTGEGEMLSQSETFNLDQYLKEKGCTSLEMDVIKSYFALDNDTRQKVFAHFQSMFGAAKELLSTNVVQQHEETATPKLKNAAEMTDAELHAELNRQLLEEKRQKEKGSAFWPGSSETATG